MRSETMLVSRIYLTRSDQARTRLGWPIFDFGKTTPHGLKRAEQGEQRPSRQGFDDQARFVPPHHRLVTFKLELAWNPYRLVAAVPEELHPAFI